MKFKIVSLNCNYLTWKLNGILGKCEFDNGKVKRTFLPDPTFSLPPDTEKMVTDCVQMWYSMKYKHRED